jgi:hypothetical protein
MAAIRQAAPQRPGVPADRQRRARQIAYLGCAAALGYGMLKLISSLGGTIGLRDPKVLRATLTASTGVPRFFDYWGTPVLAGLAVVVLLGLVYPWGEIAILRPLLRTLAWAGSLVAVPGVAGLILTIGYLGNDRLGGIHPATFLFVYVCFLVLSLAFGVTAWLKALTTTGEMEPAFVPSAGRSRHPTLADTRPHQEASHASTSRGRADGQGPSPGR